MDDLKTKMEIDTLKEKLKATWEAGDFGEIAKSFEQGAEDFVTRLALLPKTSVLDVACGSGNTAIPAARTGAEVTGVDLAAYVIKQAADRAERAGIKAAFDVGDVEDMSKNALKILKDEETLLRFKANALLQAKKFDIQNIVPLYEQLYKSVI